MAHIVSGHSAVIMDGNSAIVRLNADRSFAL